MAKLKTVKVRIWAEERVTYDQVVEMTRKEYLDLKKKLEEDPQSGVMSHISGWVDTDDPDDGEFDDDNATIELVPEDTPDA